MKFIKWGILAAIFLTAALSGCAGSTGTSTTNPVLNACNAYASALFTLADLDAAGKLSTSQRSVVNQGRAIANPICEANPMPADPAEAATVQAIADKFAASQAGVK